MGRVGRIVLYVAVLALAITAGWFAFVLGGDDCASCKGVFDAGGKSVAGAVDQTLADFKQGISEDVASRVEALISAHGGETAAALDGVEATVAKTIEDGLTGLEDRLSGVLDRSLANFKQGVSDDITGRVEALISAHGGETTAALDGIEVTDVLEGRLGKLDGLERHAGSAAGGRRRVLAALVAYSIGNESQKHTDAPDGRRPHHRGVWLHWWRDHRKSSKQAPGGGQPPTAGAGGANPDWG